MSSEYPLWRNLLGLPAFLIVTLLAMIAVLIYLPFARSLKRSPEEVVQYLRDFIEGTGGEWDIDDFTSISIADPRLESIRVRAANVELPVTEEGLSTLRTLLAEAEALASAKD